MRRNSDRDIGEEAGSVSIEIALFLPVIVMLLLGAVDLYHIMQAKASLDHLADQISRSSATPDDVLITAIIKRPSAVIVQTVMYGGQQASPSRTSYQYNPDSIPCEIMAVEGHENEIEHPLILQKVTACGRLPKAELFSGYIGEDLIFTSSGIWLAPLRNPRL